VKSFFVIDAVYKNERNEQVVCSLKKVKKNIKAQWQSLRKFSDHVGFIPLVIISPADQDLIVEGSETRSLWIASSLSWTHNTCNI
jgi:DNA replication and repair protein RecF